MIDNLISALKLSISQCSVHRQDPQRYLNEVNQVLNRYKTNLFKSVVNPQEFLYDPREFIQFRITGEYATQRGFKNTSILTDKGRAMLYVNGFFPDVNSRINKEKIYHKAVCIDDVFDLTAFHEIANDHYYRKYRPTDGQRTEQQDFEIKLGNYVGNMNIYFQRDARVDEVFVFNFQINAEVHHRVMSDYHLASAERMVVGPITRWGKTDAERIEHQLKKEGRNKPTKVKGGIKTCFFSE